MARKSWFRSDLLRRFDPWPRRIATVALIVALWPLAMTFVYAVLPPPASNLMIIRLLNGNGLAYDWVSLDRISPYLPIAVVASEDQRFCSHDGVDWIEFGDVLDEATDGDGEGPIRGASTISMQTAKNLFLWDGRNPLRKVLELPLAYWMDLVWTKRRMIEVYLNIVEWAPGVYGAEAASRYHFRKPAARLTRREAALLAAVLPNPIKRRAGKPSKRVSRTADRIMARMNVMGPYVTCLGLGSPL
ncbi:MAG: monofunctional biosynthetic peptidoglycan transglycosylase [Parvibaculaceae bacterium]